MTSDYCWRAFAQSDWGRTRALRDGEEVARHLPNSRHVVIPEAGHGVDGLLDPGCMDRIAIEFLDKGDAKNLDVNCVERMAPPPFVTK